MTSELKKPKLCVDCGKGQYRRIARAGRIENYKGFEIEIPAEIELLECDICHEILMGPEDMEKLAPVIEASYFAQIYDQ